MVDFDVIIVGSGPAGMNACLYATRANLKTLVIEKNYPGGKIVKANKIENWLGKTSIEGADLALDMFRHSFSYGGVYEQGNVLDVIDHSNYKEVVLENKKYTCYAVIICVGTSERKIGISGEEKFYGKGVSYCAICDASLYKNKTVVVVGNSNHALEETLYLSKFANNVILINEKGYFEADDSFIELIEKTSNIEVKNNSKVELIGGNDYVEYIVINNNEKEKIKTDAIFPLIGSSPDSLFTKRLKIVNEKNYIIVNEKQETNINGIYAAGDCTNGLLKQIVTASSDGAIAAMEAYKFINTIKKEGKHQ